MNKLLSHLLGKKVIVHVKSVQVVGKLVSLPETFSGRDAIVQFPFEKKTRRVWASKVEEIK